MGILKDILVGGAAWKALKRSDRPGVFPPSGYTVLGMEHIGMGRTWKIIYCKDKRPNIKLNFKIRPGVEVDGKSLDITSAEPVSAAGGAEILLESETDSANIISLSLNSGADAYDMTGLMQGYLASDEASPIYVSSGNVIFRANDVKNVNFSAAPDVSELGFQITLIETSDEILSFTAKETLAEEIQVYINAEASDVAPILSLPTDPLKRLAGGPELASAAMAWGEQEIWCSRYQEAALVWFYSGTPTKVLINRDFPARSSQFGLWDQSTPTSGLFIRPYRSSDYVELEPYGKEITDSGLVHHELTDGEARNWQIYQFASKPGSQH